MSYPPRPPMRMPHMMGPPQNYGYAPIGMMPMGMGMMPMMQHQMNHDNSVDKNKKKLVPQEIPKKEDKKEEKAPVTTVFVGNISERAPDAMIRQMLQRCGNVLSWKRVQGASGKLQAFGFCEYEAPEATLRAIRLLHNWTIPDRRLVVKVDAKTKALLDDWGRRKKDTGDDKKQEEGEIVDDKESTSEELDEFTLREDRVAKAGLDAIMREYAAELERDLPPGVDEPVDELPKRPKKEKLSDGPKDAISKRNLGLDDMELEDEKKEIINREIRSFRDTYKEDEEEAERDSRRRRDLELRDRDRQRDREMREREARERERESSRRMREPAPKSRSRSRERERTVPSRPLDPENEEEEYERRKLERKLRDKEKAYQDLLMKWEQRERKKSREYEKERDREDERKAEEAKEGRRLKEFLEDYDDERDDPKYYKGGALQRRMKEREKEMEADDRDRQREKEEIEELRRKLTDEDHSDVEGEVAKLENERDAHLMPRLNKSMSPDSSSSSSPEQKPTQPPPPPPPHHHQQHYQQEESPESDSRTGIIIPPQPPQQPPSVHSESSDGDNDNVYPSNSHSPETNDDTQSQSQSFSQFYHSNGINSQSNDEVRQTVHKGFAGVGGSGPMPPQLEPPQPKRKKLTRDEVFNQDNDSDSNDGPKKRKLVPLDYTDEERRLSSAPTLILPKPTTAEEKRKCIKNLIERIPTAKEELFAFSLDWTMVDTTLMERRIKPWVNRKIVEYIGEEEPTLSDFICQKVMGHCSPNTILSDIAMVLDEEAEVFVVKMWRLLIYETEAKKLGLVK